MTDSTRAEEAPATDAAPSYDESVADIANLLDAPEGGTEAGAANEDAEDAAADEADEAEGAEDEADEEADQDGDGEREIKGGQFAPKNAKVTLRDGSVLSVEDLKRGYLPQEERTEFERLRAEVRETGGQRETLSRYQGELESYANSLAQQRDFLLQAAQMFLPQEPDDSLLESDPIGYWQEKARYDKQAKALNQLQFQRQQDSGRMTEKQQAEYQKRVQQEARKLVETFPEYRDQRVYQQAWSETLDVMQEYGYSPEEVAKASVDHRLYKIYRDLVKLKKAQKAAPKVSQELAAKPKLMQGGKRMDPKAKISRERQARFEALRKTGDFEAGVAALMDIPDL